MQDTTTAPDQDEKNLRPADDEKAPEQQVPRESQDDEEDPKELQLSRRITFDQALDHHPRRDTALYIPGPRDRERGTFV